MCGGGDQAGDSRVGGVSRAWREGGTYGFLRLLEHHQLDLVRASILLVAHRIRLDFSLQTTGTRGDYDSKTGAG